MFKVDHNESLSTASSEYEGVTWTDFQAFAGASDQVMWVRYVVTHGKKG